jgi:hypothetical protein
VRPSTLRAAIAGPQTFSATFNRHRPRLTDAVPEPGASVPAPTWAAPISAPARARHTDDTHERCTAPNCRCEGFLHDEESWAALAEDVAGRTDEVLDAVSRSLDRSA